MAQPVIVAAHGRWQAPGWQEDRLGHCQICHRDVGPVWRRRHHCRACGILVCADCSPYMWAPECLPAEFNRTNAAQVRVCRDCNTEAGTFARALQAGDLQLVANMTSGKPFLAFCQVPHTDTYPAHVAAAAGHQHVLSFLVEAMHCNLAQTDSHHRTPLAVAAQFKQYPIVLWLVMNHKRTFREINDLQLLQETADGLMRLPHMAQACVSPNTSSSPTAGQASGGANILHECVICMDLQAQYAVIPCGHIVYCTKCAPQYSAEPQHGCPVCRRPGKLHQVFFS